MFAIVLAIPFLLGVTGRTHTEFWAGLALLGFLQLMAAVLNLVPVPGLDGGNILRPWLPLSWKRTWDVIAPFGFIMLFALLWNPTIGGVFFSGVFTLGDLIGMPSYLYSEGFALLRFWTYQAS